MPYGTSVAVGALCGFVGMAGFAVSERPSPDHMPPRRVPTELVSPAVVVQPAMSLSAPIARTLISVPPEVADADHVFAAAPAMAVRADAEQAAGDVRLPVGQHVNVRLISPILVGPGRITGFDGMLMAANDEWVVLRYDGKDRYIARNQILMLSADPQPAGVAAAD